MSLQRQEPANAPWPIHAWAEIAPADMTMHDIFAVFQHVIRDWLDWGAEHAAAATPDQNRKTMDAIVLLETNYTGVEPTVGNDWLLRMAQARRAQLELLSGAELAHQCRTVRDEASARDQEFAAFLTQQRSERGQASRDRVSKRYWYAPALEELARYYRAKGWSAQRAIRLLGTKPYHCGDGTILTAKDGRIVMEHPDRKPTEIAAARFRKAYWPRAK